ncbi:glycosyltransferase [Desulfococcaceae bacterium HSG7]|nr:glycosyltransferase [Desulfococcaceae bacterium HSG7]
MSLSKISVIIPTYNQCHFLIKAINSVFSTQYANIEIIIIDDASTDGTYATACTLADKYKGHIQVLQHPDKKNHGEGASRNLGIRASQGKYICFLDSDDYFLPNRFETCVPMLDTNPSIDGIFEDTRSIFLKGSEHRIGIIRPVVSFNCDDYKQILEKIIHKGKHWHTNAITLRKSILTQVGGFSEDSEQFRGCEDLVLWLKLACIAKLVRGNDEPVAVYVNHSANNSSSDLISQIWSPLSAYLEAFLWSKSNKIYKPKHNILKDAVIRKLFYASDCLRQAQRPDIALTLLLKVFLHIPSLAVEKLYWGNIIFALKEYFFSKL